MNTFLTILRLLPVILSLVQAVEVALPLPKSGAAKLELVLQGVSDVYDASSELQQEIGKSSLVTIVQNLVNRSVATLNHLGVFKKST